MLENAALSHSKCFRRKIRTPIELHTWDNSTRLELENDGPETPSLSQLVTWFQEVYPEPESFSNYIGKKKFQDG